VRALLPSLALAALLAGAAPLASAQLVQPVTGAFEDVYLVTGRVVDSRGEPVAGADLTVGLSQTGVRAAPLRAVTNCKGDFITSFNLRAPTVEGSVSVTVRGRDGVPDASATARFDPFFRRNDLVVRLEGPSDYRCAPSDDVWPIAVSVTGRVVNRTDPRERDGVTYESEPFRGQVRLRFVDANGTTHCPPAANAPPGVCDFLYVDERGDFRYTFTFPGPVDANGTMALVVGNKTYPAQVDPLTRQAVLLVETTGRGAPVPASPAPGPGLLPLALAVLGAALLARRLRR
jgi:hypothetical protein